MYTRIKDLREDSDRTQREISEYLFCDQSLYSKYERGLREVPVNVVIKLAKLYGTIRIISSDLPMKNVRTSADKRKQP